jgi:hypothetical protein
VGRRLPHSLRGELVQAEDASWAEFRAITGRLNPEQMGRPAESGITHHEEHLPRLREWVDLLEIPE